MAEAKTTAKKRTVKDTSVVKDIESKVEEVVGKVVEVTDELAKKLEGKTVQELRQIQSDALWAESEAKRELYKLRLRAANLATDVGPEVEDVIKLAKEELAKAVTWLQTVEKKLENEFKDIYETRF